MSSQIYPARSNVPIPQGVALPAGFHPGILKPGKNPYPRDVYFPWMAARANEIRNGHIGTKKDNVLANDTNLIGLLGEYAFMWWSHIPMRLDDRPEGDRNIDFETPKGRTIDVKTTRANMLFRPVGEKRNDIFVLALCTRTGYGITLAGWMHDEKVVKYPARVNPASKKNGKDILAHEVPPEDLFSMMSLWRLLQEGRI